MGHPNSMNNSPTVTQGPIWTAVNPGSHPPIGIAPAGPGNNFDPRREQVDSITQPQPPHVPHNIAPGPPHYYLVSAFLQSPPMAPRPYSPRKEMAMHIQSRFTGAMDKHQRSLDEIKACHADMAGLLEDRNNIDSRWHEEHHKVMLERDRFRQNNDSLRAWGIDLQRGNLELQEYERKYHEARQLMSAMEEDNKRLREENRMAAQLEAKLKQRESQLANARKVLKENGFDEHGDRQSVGPGERRTRKELDDWVMERFVEGSKHEEELKALVDGVESAGWKDLNGRLHTLKVYLNDMNRERVHKEAEWKRYIGHLYGSQSPVLKAGMDDAGADADDEGDGNDAVNGTGGKKEDSKPSKTVSPHPPSDHGTPNDTNSKEAAATTAASTDKMDVDA
ncbi:hypothetical protein BDD12DRAFT_864409 [Trichophaea hybrida]|nr:hypothetical protein BDD12DRAFT_864409 [Trichophaea hybrida]